MEELIQRSYEAIKNRGLITDKTTTFDFLQKISEERNELYEAWAKKTVNDIYEETVDLVTVGIMLLHHNGIDFIKEFEKVVIKNEKRAKELEAKRNKQNETNVQ